MSPRLTLIRLYLLLICDDSAQSKQRPNRGPPLRIFQSRRGHSATELQARIEEEQRESYKGTMVFEVGLDFYASDEDQEFTFEMILTRKSSLLQKTYR